MAYTLLDQVGVVLSPQNGCASSNRSFQLDMGVGPDEAPIFDVFMVTVTLSSLLAA